MQTCQHGPPVLWQRGCQQYSPAKSAYHLSEVRNCSHMKSGAMSPLLSSESSRHRGSEPIVSLSTKNFSDGDHFTTLVVYTGPWMAFTPDVHVIGEGPRAVEIDPEAEARTRWAGFRGFLWGFLPVVPIFMVLRLKFGQDRKGAVAAGEPRS
jgi:hypothetical protein